MAYTVVPLHNLKLPSGTSVPFGDGFFLQDLPPQIKEQDMLRELSFDDRRSVLNATQALCAEYEAIEINPRDLSGWGKEPNGISASKDAVGDDRQSGNLDQAAVASLFYMS
jgi:hypothetical protein